MPATPYQDSSYQYRASAATRATSVGLTIVVIALLLFMLIRMGVLPQFAPKAEVQSTSFTLTPQPRASASRAPSIKPRRQKAGGAPRKPAPVEAAPPPSPAPPVPWNVTPLSRNEFAASDISKLPAHERAGPKTSEGGEGSGSGHDSGSSAGAGEGPGGQKLFNAEWYRRPTDAELATYMPKVNMGSGWADIACKTIDHYHVDDCEELAESPGSGLSRTLKQAAWQFLVRPPRVNGTPQIGAWVRIHFDFYERREDARDGSGG